MKHKEPNVRAVSYFVIICLLSGIINSIASAATIQRTLFAEQSNALEGITNPSSLDRSSNILQMIQQVNASLLRTYIQKIQDFGPHPTGSTAGDALGKYLYNTLKSFHLSVQYDPWKYKLRSGKNIVATLQGNRSCTSIVIVSAHYDSVKVSPGANDDGSGVAVVLAVADIMSKNCFNSTVRFVLFSGEEQGLLGSHEYAQNAYRTDEHIIGDLTLDGVGYAETSDDGSKIKHQSNNQSAWMVDISTTIASLYDDEIGLEVIRLPHVPISDHESFVKYHFDASYLWGYSSSPYYHTSEDTLEHMNITYLTKICKLTVGTLASMAELHPRLSDSDLKVSIKGRALTYPYQFCVRIENEKPRVDSANVTINVAVKNLRTGQYVLMIIDTQTVTCNWTFTEEIKTVWEVKAIGRQYSNQIISLEVIVKGIKDDVTLYTTQRTIGVIIGRSVYLIPKC